MDNFFERFDRFYETSTTGTIAKAGGRSQRLARRWEAIVWRNATIFRDARVLDIASQDGRWSMAALDAGAHHVIGVEGRPELVDARANEWRRLIDSICDQVSCIDAAVRVKAASLNQPPPVKSSRG